MRATTACRILRSVSLCLLVVVGILVAGCDSSGSNGGDSSGPDWVGTWKVTSVTYPSAGEKAPPLTTYWEITNDTFTETTRRIFGCVSSPGDEIDTGDNVLTYTQADGDGGTVEGRFEASDGTLTVEVMEASNESYTQITAESIDREDADCLKEN